jgi:hypothetical protein
VGSSSGRRSWVVVIVLILVTVIVAAPAFALVEKSGFKDCGANNVAVRSLGTETVRHYAPTGTQIGVFQNHDDFIVRNTTTLYNSTSWKVTSTGSLNDSGTYAWCWGT